MTLSGYESRVRTNEEKEVLIPLLVDDPLWVSSIQFSTKQAIMS